MRNIASKTALTAIAILLIITHLSAADTIVQKQNFSGVTGLLANLTFDKFNASGTLTSVEITLNLQITGGSLIIDNDGSEPAIGTFEFGTNAVLGSTDVSMAGGPGMAQALNYLPIHLQGNFNDGDNDFSPDSPDGNLYNGSTVSDTKSGLISDLIQYEGNDTYNIAVAAFLHTEHNVTGKIEFYANPFPAADGYVEVVYTYEPVPEPATICLFSFGTLSMIRRKNYA